MISRISGKLKEKKQESLLIEVNSIFYEVFVPPAVMKTIDSAKSEDGTISLVTFHYFQQDPSKGVPILIGFLNEVEKEFFERFITVSGIGPRKAMKAFNQPLSIIARAIDAGDMSLLQSLPGIGQQRSREIIAKLQGKVGKFALIQDEYVSSIPQIEKDAEVEALEVLIQLQYKKQEAKAMIRQAIDRNPKVKTAEDILNEVYKQKLK